MPNSAQRWSCSAFSPSARGAPGCGEARRRPPAATATSKPSTPMGPSTSRASTPCLDPAVDAPTTSPRRRSPVSGGAWTFMAARASRSGPCRRVVVWPWALRWIRTPTRRRRSLPSPDSACVWPSGSWPPAPTTRSRNSNASEASGQRSERRSAPGCVCAAPEGWRQGAAGADGGVEAGASRACLSCSRRASSATTFRFSSIVCWCSFA